MNQLSLLIRVSVASHALTEPSISWRETSRRASMSATCAEMSERARGPSGEAGDVREVAEGEGP